MTNDSRRQVAINMLDQWHKAQANADWYIQYCKTGNPTSKQSAEWTRDVLVIEADALREEILMLMGVDDTPAAELTITAEQEGFSIDNSERKD
jgi:hypothetical protein